MRKAEGFLSKAWNKTRASTSAFFNVVPEDSAMAVIRHIYPTVLGVWAGAIRQDKEAKEHPRWKGRSQTATVWLGGNRQGSWRGGEGLGNWWSRRPGWRRGRGQGWRGQTEVWVWAPRSGSQRAAREGREQGNHRGLSSLSSRRSWECIRRQKTVEERQLQCPCEKL